MFDRVKRFCRRSWLYLMILLMVPAVLWEARHFLYLERLRDGTGTARYTKAARQSEAQLRSKVRGGHVTIGHVFDHSATSVLAETDKATMKLYLKENAAVALAWAAVVRRKEEPELLVEQP